VTSLISVLAAAMSSLALLADPSRAAEQSIRIDYAVSVRGFSVGSARLDAALSDETYSIAFSGGIRGLARIFSDAETSANVTGTIGPKRLQPVNYSHVWIEDNETETVTMRFEGTRLTEMVLDPPRARLERYVPITAAQNADVLDPVSAFVWQAPDGLKPELCDRTLPLADGRRRFNAVLSYNRAETFSTRDRSFSADAIVCSVGYLAVGGHRIGRPNSGFVAAAGGMEASIAEVAEGWTAPVRIEVRARIGRVVLSAGAVSSD